MRKFTYVVSGMFVVLSVAALLVWGLKLGVDFTGGSLLEIEYQDKALSIDDLQKLAAPLNYGAIHFQPVGEKGVLMRSRNLSEDEHQKLLLALQGPEKNVFEEKRFDSIGPTIGKELRRRAVTAIILVLALIVIYIAWAFRKVSKPVSSWKYGIAAIIALFHDVTIPTGTFAILGHFWGVEVDALFVTALLTVLGFSVHDTIVVFDRIRENLRKQSSENFAEVVNISINETMTRSINTSATVILVLFALFFFGAESTKFLSLALLIGVFFGTYSSIFLASPLLVSWEKWRTKRMAAVNR